LPELSAVVVAVEAPPRVTVAALPAVAGLIDPEIVQLADAAVKLIPLASLVVRLTCWLAGLNVKPVLLGVTVYEPLVRFPKL
jgi:hypothetical protein